MRLCLFLVTWKCNNDRTFFCFYKYLCSACKRKFYVINAGGVNNIGSSVQGYSFHKFKSGFKYQCNITFYYSQSFPKKMQIVLRTYDLKENAANLWNSFGCERFSHPFLDLRHWGHLVWHHFIKWCSTWKSEKYWRVVNQSFGRNEFNFRNAESTSWLYYCTNSFTNAKVRGDRPIKGLQACAW